MAKDVREAVQFMCLLLFYAGILHPYSKGDKPSTIEAVCEGMNATFNCWYTRIKNDPWCVSFQLEAFYVKRVRISFILTQLVF